MKWKNLLKVAFKSIIKNKMRTLLTMLGIIIGVAAVIVMVAIGKGAEKRIQDQIASMGTNLITIFPGSMQSRGVRMGPDSGVRLTLDDVELLKKNATLIQAVSPMVRTGAQLIGGSGNWNSSVWGVSEQYLEIRDWPLSSGEFFSSADIRTQNKVCIIGQTIVKNLFANDDPVGQQLRVGKIPFRIIGVLKEKGQGAFGQDQDDLLIAPYSTVLYRMSGHVHVNQILVRAVSLEQMTQAQAEITSILRGAHKIAEGEDDDFTVRNQTDIAATAEETTQVLTILLTSIASISLLVGGIGIMNIMLVSVTERTHEIGIRMAIGARSRDILVQFLIEAIVLSLSGGLIGVLLGFLATWIVGLVTDWNTVIVPANVLLSFGFAGAVGVFFGYYPARKAAALNPIEALRYE
ncbi:MAG: ABC transporter permease [Acidobacteriota bacterium]|jgi:putative ABC transport system permease protein|nr:ABC transporter permease [Acidobacteriota bacterium]